MASSKVAVSGELERNVLRAMRKHWMSAFLGMARLSSSWRMVRWEEGRISRERVEEAWVERKVLRVV